MKSNKIDKPIAEEFEKPAYVPNASLSELQKLAADISSFKNTLHNIFAKSKHEISIQL